MIPVYNPSALQRMMGRKRNVNVVHVECESNRVRALRFWRRRRRLPPLHRPGDQGVMAVLNLRIRGPNGATTITGKNYGGAAIGVPFAACCALLPPLVKRRIPYMFTLYARKHVHESTLIMLKDIWPDNFPIMPQRSWYF
jgi:hypothetical protein